MNITKRKPFTPGEILAEEFMEPYGLTQVELAKRIGVHRRRMNEIIRGKRAITPDTAVRLAIFFKMTPDYWLNLQMKTDLWNELHTKTHRRAFAGIRPIKATYKTQKNKAA